MALGQNQRRKLTRSDALLGAKHGPTGASTARPVPIDPSKVSKLAPDRRPTWILKSLSKLTINSFYSASSSPTTMLSDAPLGTADVYSTVDELTRKTLEKRRRRKHHKKKLRTEQRGHGRKRRKGQGSTIIFQSFFNLIFKILGKKNKNRLMRSPLVAAVSVDTGKPQCHRHHVERCSWPQCNPSCPKLHNPFTGKLVYIC